MNILNNKIFLLSSTLAVLLAPIPAAQAQVNFELEDISDFILDEIVVTAQRRTQRIQDVPIAIVSATNRQMETAGVRSFKDIAMLSSGVQVNDPSNFIFPFIRGIGSFVQSGSTNSSVSVYLDGVYLPRLSATALELDNVKQLEILKGPQATLYGRNATGGTIKITTKTAVPKDEFEGKVSVTVGDYGHRRGSFFVSSGLSDSFAANLSGYKVKRDGFNKNLAAFNQDVQTGKNINEDMDNLDAEYINAKFTWMPNDDLTATLSMYSGEYYGTAASGMVQLDPNGVRTFFTNTGNTLAAAAAIELNPIVAAQLAAQSAQALATAANAQFPNKKREHYSHADRASNETKGIHLAIDYSWNNLDFKSLTTTNSVKSNASSEVFGAQFAIGGFEGVTDSKDFQQEFQLSAIDGDGIDWMIGANYFKEESDDVEDLVGIEGAVPILNSRVDWNVKAESLFAEVYYDLTDALSLTLGARYTEETFEGTPILDVNAPAGLISVTQSVDDEATTYRAVLDYSTDWGLVYGSVSTGFKSGGLVSANITGGAYEAEELTAFEIGAKATLANGRVQLNAATFLYDFSEVQSQLVGGPTGGAVFFVSGDEAKVSGVELDVLGQVSERLAIQAGATYLIRREYKDFFVPANASVMTAEVNASGNDMVGAAELTAVLGVQYSVPIIDVGTLTSSLNANYNSGSYHDLENLIGTGGLNDDDYTIVNARVSLLTDDEKIEVSLWINNLTDEYYFRSGLVAQQGATKLGMENQPRHFGTTATFRF